MMRLDNLPNKRPNEKLELFLRRYWFELLKLVLFVVLLYAIPALAAAVFWPQASVLLAKPVLGPISAAVTATYILAVWLFAFFEFVDYYLDTWIVTNERIINIEQHGLFHRVSAELHLSQVEDVASELRGPLHTLFDYGDVHVQTAAERVRFHFKNVANPDLIKQKVLHLVYEDKKRHRKHNHA